MPRQVLQFKITLVDSNPIIWRQIQISDLCTFWSLHVAIQDAMGWEDYHLHEFEVVNPATGVKERIGIPNDEFAGELATLPGWDLKVMPYLSMNQKIKYTYDFGDDWEHEIEFEGAFSKSPAKKYPTCLDGERACPPEDVGGIGGFYEYVKAIKDKTHPQHRQYLDWRGKFNPNKFNTKNIKFHSASSRLKQLQSQIGE